MNPPFTKVERGIKNYVDMTSFSDICGNDVGLWGHFLALVDDFLNEGGIFGGVIPISLLRGKETNKIREFVFSNWTPIYILKSTFNYGFSEYAEYRDILLVARKGKPPTGHKVKFGLLKRNLTELTSHDIYHIANRLEIYNSFSSSDLDIESFSIDELQQHFANLMWFCGIGSMDNRKSLVSFINGFSNYLIRPPNDYFREGYRPVPMKVSSFLFLTRNLDKSRIEEAVLFFNDQDDKAKYVKAYTHLNVSYNIDKTGLKPSLRTGIGLNTMNISNKLDFIASGPYDKFDQVLKATKFKKPKNFVWNTFWNKIVQQLNSLNTKMVTLHRINPFSPSTHLTAFLSNIPFCPSNVLNIVIEQNIEVAKAFCLLLNSIVFLSQFFLLKEETTGRYINIRFYDYYQMNIFPHSADTKKLASIFDRFSGKEFPSLADQLDKNFEARYSQFWLENRKGQKTLLQLAKTVDPIDDRLNLDTEVCNVLGLNVSRACLIRIYTIIVNDMIIIRGLRKD
jgi:hypothetical protein